MEAIVIMIQVLAFICFIIMWFIWVFFVPRWIYRTMKAVQLLCDRTPAAEGSLAFQKAEDEKLEIELRSQRVAEAAALKARREMEANEEEKRKAVKAAVAEMAKKK